MSIYHTTPTRCESASAEIARKIAEFKAGGGRINQIPRGQSAHNLTVRPVSKRGRGTRIAWEDPRLSMQSPMAKAASVRQIEDKKAREKARKR